MMRWGSPRTWLVAGAVIFALATAGWGYWAWSEQRSVDRLLREAAQYMAQNELLKAEPLYRRILQYRPDHLEGVLGLEQIYRATDREEPADQLSDWIKQARPRDWKEHLLLAYWWSGFREYGHAERHLREVLKAQPDHAMARRMLSVCLFSRARYEEAQKVLAHQLNVDPRDAVTHYLMGKALYYVQQFEQARGHFAAMIAYGSPERPEYGDALYRLTQLDADAGRLSEAREWLALLRRIEEGPRIEQLESNLRQREEEQNRQRNSPKELSAQTGGEPIRFRPASSEIGIDFHHYSPFSSLRYLPETFGAGLAIFDFDGDGHVDLYFVNGGTITDDGPQPGPPNRLYRNLGNGTFEDVTEPSGAGDQGYGHGVIVGDYDNDGDPDLYIANYGPNVLLQNQGDGTFRDVTAEAGVADPRLSCGGAFLDIDRDGDLDLYVSNYCKFDPRTMPRDCKGPHGQTIFCTPHQFEPEDHILYLNHGDGIFTEVTRQAGVYRTGYQGGRGFGVVATDVNIDGLIDLYVANDETPNFLFIGRGDGTFEDRTETGGADRNLDAHPLGSMGAEAGDLDRDGRPELFVTNYWRQANTLYRNAGPGVFLDITASTVGHSSSMYTVGWGTAFADFDNDGWLDLIVTNGHVNDNVEGEPFTQRPQLWLGRDQGRFVDVSDQLDGYFLQPHAGRGLAVGDLDNDGDLDVVMNHLNEPAVVLFNETPASGSWIRLELNGVESNRDAIGTRVVVEAGGRQIHRQVQNGGSYLSCHDNRLLIGLGPAERVDRLTIHWPNGSQTVREQIEINRGYQFHEPSRGLE